MRTERSSLRDEAVECIRKVMIINCDSGKDAAPEERLIIDIIIQAMSDAAGIDPEFTREFDRKEAERFFIDGRCKDMCEMVGLDYNLVLSLKKGLLSEDIQTKIKRHKHKELGLYGRCR